MSDPFQSRKPVFSEFANDPDMCELVELFANEMPEKINRFEAAIAGEKLEELRRLAHQLKGSAGGYGFGIVGEAAGRLEERLVSSPGASGSAAFLDQVKRDLDDLLDLCRSVRARP